MHELAYRNIVTAIAIEGFGVPGVETKICKFKHPDLLDFTIIRINVTLSLISVILLTIYITTRVTGHKNKSTNLSLYLVAANRYDFLKTIGIFIKNV